IVCPFESTSLSQRPPPSVDALKFSAAAVHCRISCNCCGDVWVALASAPLKQRSSIAEPAVPSLTLVRLSPQELSGRNSAVTSGCSPQKPGERCKQPAQVSM